MMIEGFETKQCSKCGGIFALSSFQEGRNQCKACRKEAQKAWRESDKGKAWQKARDESDKGKAWRKAWDESGKGKAWRKAWDESGKGKARYKKYGQSDKGKARYKKYNKKIADELRDCYLVSLLTNASELKASDIPPELIEIKRLQIKIKREIACQTN